MATALVHVLTIIGEASRGVEKALDEFVRRRVQREPNCFGTEDWSDVDRAAIDQYSRSLIDAANSLPVYYYATYLDAWSTANEMFHRLDWPDGRRRHIVGDCFSSVFYPPPHEPFLTQIAKRRRQRMYRKQSESRWFLNQIDEAIGCATWLKSPFLVLAISESLGPGRSDDDVLAALNLPINLAENAEPPQPVRLYQSVVTP